MNKPTKQEIEEIVYKYVCSNMSYDEAVRSGRVVIEKIMSLLEPKSEVPEWQETINYIADSMKRLLPSRPNERLEFDGIEVTEYLTRFMKDQFKKMADELQNEIRPWCGALIWETWKTIKKEVLRKRGVE